MAYGPLQSCREVIAVFEDRADLKPSYIMWLEWRDGRISFIHDYRYVPEVAADTELALAPEAKPADNGATQSQRAILLDPMQDRYRGHILWIDRRNHGS